ncbi:acyl-CoA dehydrogenase family protein [Ottowia sp.]|uniref:acyl-CoA dehydrogenase family protein n=1 Tax=Ottowia sp. TaxID=1898956 RepID=UPI0039E6CD43
MIDLMMEESAARLFAGNVDKPLLERFEAGEFPQALWDLAVDSGFGRALAGEDAGGIGATWLDAYPLLRGIGYWQVPLPLSETMIAALLLSAAGLDIPPGPLAVIERGHGNEFSTSGAGSALRLWGCASRVAWARHAGHALVSLRSGDLALIDLRDTGTVSVTPGTDLARVPADMVRLDAAPILATAPNPLPVLARPVLQLGALARSMMMVGALESALEQSVRYANDRIQFGKPIGRNQAIQQPLALMAGDVSAARVATLVAAADTPSSTRPDAPAAEFSIAVAKARCGEAATRGTAIAHQTHGAIGFTYEHPLNFATRRLWAWRDEFGSDAWWAQQLGRAAIGAGGQGFWSSLTRRSFPAPLGLA